MSKKVTIKTTTANVANPHKQPPVTSKNPAKPLKPSLKQKSSVAIKSPSEKKEVLVSQLKAPTSSTESPGKSYKPNESLSVSLAKLSVAEVETQHKEKKPTQVINLKKAVIMVFHQSDLKLNESEKWPVYFDPEGLFSSFCRVRETRYVNCTNIVDMLVDVVRDKVLTAYYYGHPLVIDIGFEKTNLERFRTVCDEVDAKLYEDLCDKKYRSLYYLCL